MEKIRDTLFDAMTKEETPIYEPKMNIFLKHIGHKHLSFWAIKAQ